MLRKQSYHEYLKTRIKFHLEVGFWNEYGEECDLEVKDTKFEKIIKGGFGDVNVNILSLPKIVRKSPKEISEKLTPYVESVYGLDRVEFVNGYMNFYFDRMKFFMITLNQ
jgi:arginyl-tRNA synthetase